MAEQLSLKRRNSKKKNWRKKGVGTPKKPYRDVYRDGITYSFLSEFLQCRESARLTFVEGWSAEGLSVPLDYGSAWHDCMQWIAEGNSPNMIARPLKKYQDSRGKNLKNKDDRQVLDMLIQMVKKVFPIYCSYWAKADKDKRYVYQEESFQVLHTLPNAKKIPLRGRLDAAYHRISDGQFILEENKTKGNIDEAGIQASLHMDMQTMMYSLALRLLCGHAPNEVLYNVARRPQQRLKKNETPTEFINRVAEDVESRPQWYFMRWQVAFLDSDLDHWVTRTFNPILMQVVEWWESIAKDPFNPWNSPHHYVSPEGLFTRYGRSRYFDAITKRNFYGLKRRT